MMLLAVTVAGAAGPLDRGEDKISLLRAAGLAESGLAGIRPLEEEETERVYSEAYMMMQEYQGSERAKLLSGTGIAADMEEYGGYVEGGRALAYLKPVERFALEYTYLEGGPSAVPGTNASTHPLVYNNEGIEPEEGSTLYLGIELAAGLGPLSVHAAPLFSTDGRYTGGLHKGYAKLTLGPLALEAGRISLWWGQGRHGSLLLTTNAAPLPMVRVTNPVPVLLPWVFRRLGPFRFDVFASRLEWDRDVPEPYLAGVRLDFKPHPAVEIGLARTMMMGGVGRPGVTPERLWKMLFGENRERSSDLSNSLAGIDVRLTLPYLEIYGEAGGEDEAGGLPSEVAWIAGAYLLVPGTSVDVTVEYADITNGLWYRHSLYSSGYTYKGRLLGHHAGRRATDVFVETGRHSRWGYGSVSFDYEERNAAATVRERHYQAAAGFRVRLGRRLADWSLGVRAAIEKVRNAAYIEGREERNAFVCVTLSGVN